ncbi:uncharacterized protein LOC110455321 isoform X2 [Mizuhopecten yessoensis]|uniref:uncharacterized protein LOC110455321 isoform X2 n=1 Tax=Mizuhopecten yessoensis TaxID=6573 RepID=UPI000B45ACB9|nr:uncharacterized protein LOC110455321 isoform X2 [Mizuhopecten yessoensis]
MMIRWILGATARSMSILSPKLVLGCLERRPPLIHVVMFNYNRKATYDQLLHFQLRTLHQCKRRTSAEQNGSLSFGKVSPDIAYWANGILPVYQNSDFNFQNLKLYEKNTIKDFGSLTYRDVFSRVRYLVVQQYICHDLLKHILADATETFHTHSWSPDSIAQIMYCAFVVGNMEMSLFKDIEIHMLSDSQIYNAKQNIMLLKACIRCRKNFSVILLQKIWDSFNSFNFGLCYPKEARFLQSAFISYMACLPLKEFEKVFQDEEFLLLAFEYTKRIMEEADTIEMSEICCYIKLLKRARFYHRPLLDKVVWYINREQMGKRLRDDRNLRVRRKDLANICWALASSGMKGKNVRLCFENLQQMYDQHSSEDKINSYIVTSNGPGEHENHELKNIDMSRMIMLAAYTVAGIFHYDLIDSVLRDEIAENCLVNSRLDPLMTQTERLLLIQACVDLECPDYKGSKLSPAMVETLRTEYNLHNRLPPIPFKTRATHSAIKKIFPEEENVFHFNDRLLCLDDVVDFRYDKEKGFVPFTPMSHEELQLDTESTTKRIAIVVARANRVSVNGGKCLGWFLLQLRLLKKLKYTVIRGFLAFTVKLSTFKTISLKCWDQPDAAPGNSLFGLSQKFHTRSCLRKKSIS